MCGGSLACSAGPGRKLSDARDKLLQAYICELKAPECAILQPNSKALPPLGPGRQGEHRSMPSAIETELEKKTPHTHLGLSTLGNEEKTYATQCLVVPGTTMVNKYMVEYGRGRQNDLCLVEGERQI